MIFTVPPVLARLLAYLPWEDFLPLTRTCTALRHLLSNHELRDIVLTGFVDGYGYCLRMGDPALRDGLTEISVTWKDLDMLGVFPSIPMNNVLSDSDLFQSLPRESLFTAIPLTL